FVPRSALRLEGHDYGSGDDFVTAGLCGPHLLSLGRQLDRYSLDIPACIRLFRLEVWANDTAWGIWSTHLCARRLRRPSNRPSGETVMETVTPRQICFGL